MTRALPLLLALACQKAPLHDVGARWVLADASWFEEEETLFVFWHVEAEQGLGDPSVIEVQWTTDTDRHPWTPLSDLVPVHTHLPVDCGATARCGSASVHIPAEPRNVRLRLRYHRDGALALDASTAFNVVNTGPTHTRRSFLVYGVFDGANDTIQWRGRHQLPTLRNEEAERYGLRRAFAVRDAAFGRQDLTRPANPYGYGVTCPDTFTPAGLPEVQTEDRAVFVPEPLPLGASDASTVCAQATVTDARGAFTTGAVARKNPEVRAAFPVLRSPVHDATPLRAFLAPCDRTVSADHAAMQRQRLDLDGVPTTCIDDWQQPGFVDDLVVTFRDAIDAARPAGEDMVLVVGLHQDEAGVSERVEDALARLVPAERHRSSPRVVGAFVLDSEIRGITLPELRQVALWCPASLEDQITDASSRSCAIAPDNPEFDLGPFTFGTLPILPSRTQYLDFIDTYSPQQAGEVESLTFRAPEFATTSDHVDLGEFGAVTFLDGEAVDADADDAFSWCVDSEPELVLFRSDLLREILEEEDCADLGLPPEACAAGLLPLEWLPEWHDTFREPSYALGVFWEFPFLLRMDYRAVAAGQVSAFGFSVPFGVSNPDEAYYGTSVWTRDEFVLADNLLQCERFCDHPTFDDAGVYHVTDPFRTTYAQSCYRPAYPAPGDSGFPRDP